MTDEQHVEVAQEREFVRCKEDVPKRRKSKHQKAPESIRQTERSGENFPSFSSGADLRVIRKETQKTS